MCLSLETSTSIIRIGLPILVELIDLVNSVIIFSISDDLTLMVNFPTPIPDCDSHSPVFLDLFLSSEASLCTTVAFPSLGNSDHVADSFSIDFPSYSQQDAPFHHIAYNYSPADWDSLCDHLADVPWEDIFKLSASAAASEFCEWVHVGLDVHIPRQKYQVKPHSSPWFSAACAAAIVHRNHVFCLHKKDKSSESEKKFRQANNCCKKFLKLPNLHMLIKQKNPSLPRHLALRTFGELPMMFSTKVNLLYLLYSTACTCCLLHLIKQNSFLKIF